MLMKLKTCKLVIISKIYGDIDEIRVDEVVNLKVATR